MNGSRYWQPSGTLYDNDLVSDLVSRLEGLTMLECVRRITWEVVEIAEKETLLVPEEKTRGCRGKAVACSCVHHEVRNLSGEG